MRILMITHFTDLPNEPGNNRFKYLAEKLAQRHKVKVITTSFSHDKKTERDTDCVGEAPYDIQMCYEPHYSKNVSLKRFYSHLIFARNVKKYLSNCEKPDVIYCAIPSLDVAVVAGKYAKQNGIRYIVDIQDLWPEAFKMVFNVPIISDLIFLPFTWLANRAYKFADVIIGVSETYMERGLKCNKHARSSCVYLGTSLKQFDRNCELSVQTIDKPKNEIWIIYVGTLGYSYNLDIVLEALSQIKNKNYRFVVLGDGPMMDEFRRYAEGKKVNAEFLGRLEYSSVCAYLNHADIAVNPISKGAAQSIINKHADYSMAGLPIVNTQECAEYRKLITEYGCGINCGVDSVDDVRRAIEFLIENPEERKRMGSNSRRLAETKFDRDKTYNVIMQIVEEQ